MEEFYTTAIEAAKKAGRLVQSKSRDFREVNYKGRADMVTEVDRESERMIVDLLTERYPDHGVIAEEADYQKSDHSHQWIIDPLDGTTNYVHGYRHYAISIALRIGDELTVGVVYDPGNDELYSAKKGGGAFLNDDPISVSETSSLSNSLLSTGIPYKISEVWYRSFDLFKAFYMRTHGVRRDGSAALDLAYVGAGRLDGFWEYDLNPWDVSAGMLIVQEAGGLTRDFHGDPSSIFDKEILAVNNSEMLDQILQIIQSYPGYSTKKNE